MARLMEFMAEDLERDPSLRLLHKFQMGGRRNVVIHSPSRCYQLRHSSEPSPFESTQLRASPWFTPWFTCRSAATHSGGTGRGKPIGSAKSPDLTKWGVKEKVL